MSFSLAVVVPLILYAILIAAAALEDGLRLRISNVTNVAILVLGVLTLALNWNGEWWQHLLAFVIALGVGIGFYSVGWLGGDLGLNAYLRSDPGHIEAMPTDIGGAIRYTLGF